MTRAQLIIGICDRFHCLPSQLLDEDVEILQLIKLEYLGKPDS